MKHTVDIPDDPVDFLLTSAEYGHARSMLDTLRLIQAEPWQHTFDDLVTRDHAAGLYLPLMMGMRWVSYPHRPDLGPHPTMACSHYSADRRAFIELLEETCDDTTICS